MFKVERTHHRHVGGTKEYFFTAILRRENGPSLAVFQWGSIGSPPLGVKIIKCPSASEAVRQVKNQIRAKERREYKRYQEEALDLEVDQLDSLPCFSKLKVDDVRHLMDGIDGVVVTDGDMLDGPITTPEPASPPPVASVEERVKKNANWGMF
jgi:hypothetical protein